VFSKRDNVKELVQRGYRDVLPHQLASIRPEEREAIYLNIVEGYTAQEIAEITETSRNSILSLIHRGKKKLATHLEDFPDTNEAQT
jgi:DNA-directed RNA polymerase specialized sigma24 family protein